MNDTKRPKYIEQVLKKLNSGEFSAQPGIRHVVLMHDDWCRLLHGKGACNCEPEIVESHP